MHAIRQKARGGRRNDEHGRNEHHADRLHGGDDGKGDEQHHRVMQKAHRQAQTLAKGAVEAQREQSAIADGDEKQRDAGGDGHEDHISLTHSCGLAEEIHAEAGFLAGGQFFDHFEQTHADGIERGKHETHRGILFEPCGARDGTHGEHRKTADERGTDQNGQRVFGRVPKEPERDARKHRMTQGVPHERHAPHDDKAAKQAAIEPEQDAAEKGESKRGIAEGEEAKRLLGDGGFREIADAGGVGRKSKEQRAESEEQRDIRFSR